MKQSSIEWLVEQLTIHTWYDNDNNAQVNIDAIDINQAKEMHKQEIIEAKDCWFEDEDDGEQYYRNTYEKEN